MLGTNAYADLERQPIMTETPFLELCPLPYIMRICI